MTTKALASLATFWLRLRQEPESIRTQGRQAHVREALAIDLDQRVSVMMVDMAAFAGKYSSVAAALKAAGLTAQEHDAYRIALVNAVLSAHRIQRDDRLTVDATSRLGKNVAFIKSHREEIQALEATDMWMAP